MYVALKVTSLADVDINEIPLFRMPLFQSIYFQKIVAVCMVR